MKALRTLGGLAFLLACASPALDGASVQGQLTCDSGRGRSPVSGIAVTVNHSSSGRSAPSFTGGDGMYYLNLKAGTYTLEIWGSKSSNAPTDTQSITVTEPSTDVQPINLRSCPSQ
jgi:hypothetical protein